jgi:hypothetical protein
MEGIRMIRLALENYPVQHFRLIQRTGLME